MSQWLNNWQNAIGKLKPKNPEEPLSSRQTPTAFPYPTVRKTAALHLPLSPYQMAVDLEESNLFYPSIDGKIVSRSLTSGAIQWQSADFGYPLRVTDQILWAVQGVTIAAYSITDGQLLMRSHPVGLAGGVTHSVCDLSAQTLRIDSYCFHPWNGGIHGPSRESSATHQISLITGEVLEIHKVVNAQTYHGGRQIVADWLRPNSEKRVYPSISGKTLQEIGAHHSFTDTRISNCVSAQLETASIMIYHEYSADGTQRSILSIFDKKQPYAKRWDVLIQEIHPEPLRPLLC